MLNKTHIILFLFVIQSIGIVAQPVRQLRIIQSNTFEGIDNGGQKIRKLIGNVILEHDGMMLYCDSAYHFERENYFDAYGNIRIRQGDSLNIRGGSLRYDMKTKTAFIGRGVKLTDKSMTLLTPSIVYRMDNKSGYFNQGGVITDAGNRLESKEGYYFSNLQELLFKYNVVLKNEDYTLKTDSMRYQINKHEAVFIAPTEIFSEDTRIYCESGWYNTKSKSSLFEKNAIISSGSKTISGNIILYDNSNNTSQVIGNVRFIDTLEKTEVSGKYSIRSDNDKSTIVTDSALFIKYFDDDTLYMHADTLKLMQVKADSLDKDMVYAWKKVKGFSNNYKIKCDSMVYNGIDSVISFFQKPVLWTENNQISAKIIRFQTANNEFNKMLLEGEAFMAEKIDSIRYNQVKGKIMTGFFEDNNLKKVITEGNAESIYFLTDDNQQYIGRNNIQASKIEILMENKKIARINFIVSPGGKVETPVNMDNNEAFLNGFHWRELEKPLQISDIFKQ